jgi:serine protease inhibitor
MNNNQLINITFANIEDQLQRIKARIEVLEEKYSILTDNIKSCVKYGSLDSIIVTFDNAIRRDMKTLNSQFQAKTLQTINDLVYEIAHLKNSKTKKEPWFKRFSRLVKQFFIDLRKL